MDGLSSEVGNKMRSAVKAKLIELGSGTAGYVDDELPDYVMIMVANKRSKDQMITDLSLFLGKNTDSFVSWLHQVLEKLEEVTLPATSAASQPKAKRKISESTDKRDKKAKDKRRTGSKSGNSPIRSTTPPLRNAPTSITDVIADNLIQNAQLTIEPPLSVKKAQRNNGTTDGFDIPTISEIATKPSEHTKIAELAELQRQIEEAKRHLNITGESDDEDFINIRTDRNDLEGDLDSTSRDSNSNDKAKSLQKDGESDKVVRKTHNRIVFDDKEDNKDDSNNASSTQKRSVLNRLGSRNHTEEQDQNERNDNIISLSAHRRMEQAIYVAPAQRIQSSSSGRNDKSTLSSRSTVRDRSSDRSTRDKDRESRHERSAREPPRGRDTKEPVDLRERVRQKNRDLEIRGRGRAENRSTEHTNVRSRSRTTSTHGRVEKSPPKLSPSKPTLASRIGSKVQTTARKSDDYSEDEITVPVNSVIKVKPRPIVPTNKQACKNLLMRAVAEAQKSTALVKPNAFDVKGGAGVEKKELYTKSFRKNLNKDNTVEITSKRTNAVIDVDAMELAGNDDDADEYVPTSLSQDEEDPLVYIPQVINSTLHSRSTSDSSTQFVVTLDSLNFAKQKRSPHLQRRPAASPPSKQFSRLEAVRGRAARNAPISPARSSREPNRPNERNSIDLPRKRRSSPISRDNPDTHLEPVRKQSKAVDRNAHRESPTKKERNDDSRDVSNSDANESSSKIRIRSSSQSKYDNLPPLSSAITVTTNEKPKEMKRCRFYPSCTRGDRCEYVHPSTLCKSFPNCKYGEHCLYIHPKCKFDLTCSRLDCNFSHTPVASAAPPLASHVVPVTNYKKIVATPLPTLCRFYPNCSNTLCEFYHPKPCKFGKNCTNKVECNFYHFDLPASNAVQPVRNKMKWVASAT